MSGQTIGQAVATKDKGMIEQYRGDFAAVLPTHISPDQWVRVTQGELRRSAQLQTILKNNPGSVLSALLDCARLGLEVGDTYHLVPMGGEVVGIADYRGMIELMYRAGAVRAVKCEIVYEHDLIPDPQDIDPRTGRPRPRFSWEPSYMRVPHHRPDWWADRGEMKGAYAYAEMMDGAISQVVFRTRREIEKVRAVSKTAKSSTSPWSVWPDRMWLKTVLRELARMVPTSAEFRKDIARAAKAGQHEAAETMRSGLPRLAFDDDVVDAEVVADDEPAKMSDPVAPQAQQRDRPQTAA
ncbi:recombinase RecT [Lentzea sp. JNUCC 0626]|uniref:recombinase RecT n=1 Tax=Lentzea sp. JNUCC 0626 TaxID=3367513 RepID=UPI0037488858